MKDAPYRGFPWWLLRLGRSGGGRATGVLRVWLWWERLTDRVWRPRPVRDGGLLRYRLARHRGAPLRLGDGSTIAPGDAIVDLHLDNRAVARLAGGARASWDAVEALTAELRALDGLLTREGIAARAIRGMTLFAPAGRRMGFETRPLPRSVGVALARYFLVGLLAIYHPAGWARVSRLRADLWPGEVWMSRAKLAELAAGR